MGEPGYERMGVGYRQVRLPDPRIAARIEVARRASSVWHLMPGEETERGLAALEADLESGAWDERHGHLREAAELDVGLRLIAASPGAG